MRFGLVPCAGCRLTGAPVLLSGIVSFLFCCDYSLCLFALTSMPKSLNSLYFYRVSLNKLQEMGVDRDF